MAQKIRIRHISVNSQAAGRGRVRLQLAVMRRIIVVALIAAASLTGCHKSSSAKSGGDAVDQKLHQLSGSGAADCGRLKSATPDQMKTAGDCAMSAAQKRQAFYVAYDLPGMTVAVAGNSAGKLYTVEAMQAGSPQPGAAASLQAEPCPADLRVAQSGRVTCMAPGSMGAMGMHGGVTMPPAAGENPHGGMMSMPPAPGNNPHGSMMNTPPAGPTGQPPKQD